MGSGTILILVLFGFLWHSDSLRPLRERDSIAGSWSDERLFLRRGDAWNITGTYKGRWSFSETSNGSSRYLDFGRSSGVSVLELISTPTKITGVHYVQGAVTLHDALASEHNPGVAQMRVEGVYIWPFRQLRMIASSSADGEPLHEEDYLLFSPYHLVTD